jgi:hypothetical protein
MKNSIVQDYAITLQFMTATGWDMLQIIDRQARKDVGKVARFSTKVEQILTSTEAIKTYESIGRLIVIGGMVAIALGMTAADLCHGFIDSCYEGETAIALPCISVKQADQNLEAQIDALILTNRFPLVCRTMLTPSTATPKKKLSPKTKAKNIAQPATTTRSSRYSKGVTPKPTKEKTPNKKPSVTDLRTLCSTNKIKWRNAHGKNQNLTQNQMIDALKNKGLTL